MTSSARINTVPGPRILVTRSPRQSSALADRLRELGAEPVLIPTIEIIDPDSFAPLDTALAQLLTFDWLLFTSANAVEAMHARLVGLGLTPSSFISGTSPGALPVTPVISTGALPPKLALSTEAPRPDLVISTGALPANLVISTEARSAEWRNPRISPGQSRSDEPEKVNSPRIAAIGAATARALAGIGLTSDLLPPQAVAESFAAALLPHARRPDGRSTRFLLVRAEEAREHLPETLRAAGAEVTVAPAYRTVVPADSVERLGHLFSSGAAEKQKGVTIDAVTFTSASTVRNLFTLLETAATTLPGEVVRASIGPITSAALAEAGYPAQVEAEQPTVEALAAALVKYLQRPR